MSTLGNGRFGITGLSKENAANAQNEEILIQKDVGEYLIKTRNGDIISADKWQRFTNHLDNMSVWAEQLQLSTASIYEVEPDPLSLPAPVTNATNLLGNTPLQVPVTSGTTKWLLSVDMDLLKPNDDGFLTSVALSGTVKIDVRVPGDTPITGSLSIPLNQLNTRVLTLTTFVNTPDVTSFFIDSVTITTADAQLRKILHSVLIAIN